MSAFPTTTTEVPQPVEPVNGPRRSDYTPIKPTLLRIKDALRRADESAMMGAIRDRQNEALSEYVTRHHRLATRGLLASMPESKLVPSSLQGLQPDSPLGEMCRTFLPHLSADGFEAKCDPKLPADRLAAAILSARLQQCCDDTDMQRVAWELTLDGLLGMAVAKVRLMSDAVPQTYGTGRYDIDQPYVRRVPLNRWIVDPMCEGDLDRAMYIADRYFVDRGELLEKAPAHLHDLIIGLPPVWNGQRQAWDNDRITDFMLYTQDLVELIDVEFIDGRRRYCATMPHYFDASDTWIVEPYEHGPDQETAYCTMALGTAPGDLQPVSPAMAMMDAHVLTVALAKRMGEEAVTARRANVVEPGNRAGTALSQNAMTDATVYGNPNGFKEAVMGGMTEPVQLGHAMARALALQIGPYMPQAKGAAAGGSTATSDTILAGNADTIMRYWKERRDRCFNGILARMGWWLNMKPKPMAQIPMKLPDGSDLLVNFDPTLPIAKDLSWQNLTYRAVTGSRSSMDARMRQRSLVEMLQILIPTIQQVAAVGGDPSAAVTAIADAFEWSDLAAIFPTQDAVAFSAALKQMTGANVQGEMGPESRQAQMQSDYAPAMKGA